MVPCEVSGASTLVRSSPRSAWKARVSSRPASSPWEPAEGCRLTWGRPQISPRRLLQQPHQLQRPLGALGVLGRVQAGVAGQRRHPLVEPRVVLHRAGAERVEAAVEVEVAARELVVVADDLRLGDLRQARRLGAQQVGRDQLLERAARELRRRAAPRRAGPASTSRRSSGRVRPASGSRSGPSATPSGDLSHYRRQTRHARRRSRRRAPRRARRSGPCVRRSVIATRRPSSYSGYSRPSG